MIRGLYSAASGMVAIEQRQSAISNNIANASTPGFKRQAPVQLGFYEVFTDSPRRPYYFNQDSAPGGGTKFVETYTDTTLGMMRSTDNPLHAGLLGPGYFVVDTPEGERYTRSGDFTRSPEGYLVTATGDPVQSVTGGPISVDGASIAVGPDGTVEVDGLAAGKIRLIEFSAPERLTRTGMNEYSASGEVLRQSSVAANTTVQQKQLEMSNVQLPNEMINLMLGMRAYEANQRVITAVDGTMGRLIEQVGMPS